VAILFLKRPFGVPAFGNNRLLRGGSMNKNFRRTFCVLMTILLAAFALPSMALNPQKIYGLTMQPIQSDPPSFSPPFMVKATITNLSPNGNSAIDSFTLSVTGLTIVGFTPPASGTVQIDPSGAFVNVTNLSPIKPGTANAFDLTLKVASCGDGVWSAVTWTGSNLTGQNFQAVGDASPPTPISCGLLACNDPVAVTNTDTTNPSLTVTGTRGAYDKDGDTCVSVNYYVTNTLPVDKKVHFRWPTSGTQSDAAAAFKYVITAAAPPPVGFPKLAWKDSSGTPSFISACVSATSTSCVIPICTSVDLPKPYGKLAANISKTDTHIAIDTSTGVIPVPTTFPFAMVIGAERVLVTKITGSNTWFVSRQQGGTGPAAHSANDPAMATPLPLLTAAAGLYNAGDQAQMCVVGAETSGNVITVIDIGDGWVNSNP